MRDNWFVSALVLALLLTSVLSAGLGIQPLKVNGTVYQRTGGSVSSATAPTQRNSEAVTEDPAVDWWNMSRHDLSHTGGSTSPAVNINNTIWNYTTGNYVLSSPAVVDYLLYVGSLDNTTYCLNASTGTPKWNYTTEGPILFSSPAVASVVVGGSVYVYVGSADGNVTCLNAGTGARVWNFTTKGYVLDSPAVTGGKVYVDSSDGNLYCLDALTGNRIWYDDIDSFDSSPAVVGGFVYVGSLTGNVTCLNAGTGKLKWNYVTGGMVESSPAVAGGFVYVGSDDGKVYCLNASTGALAWSYKTGGIVFSSPAVANSRLYVGSDDNKTYAFGLLPTITISPSPKVTMDLSQSQTFTSAVSGGTPPYSYQWYLKYPNGTLIPVGTSSSWTFKPNSTGNYSVYANVTDVAEHTGMSNNTTVDVKSALIVSISPSLPVKMDVGQSQTFNSTEGGTSPYHYYWYVNNGLVGLNSPSYTFTPSTNGSYTVYLKVTDSAMTINTNKSNIVPVTVNPRLSVSINPTYAKFYVNQSQNFTSNSANGTAPYTYQWYLDGQPVPNATNSTWSLNSTSPGWHTVYAEVIDSVGELVKSNTGTAAIIIHGHDITITNVTIGYPTCSKTIVCQNESIKLYFVVANLGNYTETFNVTTPILPFRYNSSTISSGSIATLTLVWDTASNDYPIGNYTLTASVTLASGEANYWVGPFTHGAVKVTIPGDINGDGKVNLVDLSMITGSWLQKVPPAPPNVDIKDVGVIQLPDLTVVTGNWLKHT